MLARTRRTALTALVAATALVGSLAVASPPAGAEEPDVPYFADITGPDVAMSGDANPVVGHFTDQVFDDILWYAPGAAKETIWTPCPECESGPFTKRQLPLALQVGGSYQPLVGDFAGDGLDDIYWLSSAPDGGDYLWTNAGAGTFTVKRFDGPAGDVQPLVLTDSRSGDGKDDILWRSGTPSLSRLWVFPDAGSGTARTKAWLRIPVGEPLVGDFDGNGAADILFYPHHTSCRCETPGAATTTDTLWRRAGSEAPGFAATTMNIKGEYAPLVGRFSGEGDARDDILWVGQLSICCSTPSDRPDSLWEGRASGAFTASSPSFPSAGGAVKLDHDVADTALVFDVSPSGESTTTNVWFDTTSGPVLRPVGTQLPNGFQPVIGRFISADRADIFAYYAGSKAEHLYHPIF